MFLCEGVIRPRLENLPPVFVGRQSSDPYSMLVLCSEEGGGLLCRGLQIEAARVTVGFVGSGLSVIGPRTINLRGLGWLGVGFWLVG